MPFKLLFFVGLLVGSPLLAQPILDRTYAPTAGERFAFTLASPGPVLLPEGANQQWALTLNPANAYGSSIDSARPATTPARFRGATWEVRISTTRYFMNETDSGIIVQGALAANGYRLDWPPVTFFPYGLAYGQARVQHYIERDSNAAGVTQYSLFKDTVTYSGYGTLSVNTHTYSNCVMITSRTSGYSSVDTAVTPFALRFVHVEKLIYAPALGYTVIDYNEEVSAGSTTVQRTLYYMSNIVVAAKAYAASQEVRLWPNPGLGRISFAVPGLEAGPSTVTIRDGSGRLIETLRVASKYLDVSSLPPGLLFLEFELGGKTYRSRFAHL